jgi:hypothetical protein
LSLHLELRPALNPLGLSAVWSALVPIVVLEFILALFGVSIWTLVSAKVDENLKPKEFCFSKIK